MTKHPTALITGGAGFIGSHMADTLLDRGYRVKVIDNLRTGVAGQVPEHAEFVEGDVCDPGSNACRTASAFSVFLLKS